MLRVVVLISGTGSNLRALLDAVVPSDLPVQVVAVGADREASGLTHAQDYEIPTFVVPWSQYSGRSQWGAALAEQLRTYSPDLIVLSGLMRLLPVELVDEFAPRIINTHPAYLPEFPGAVAVADAIAAGVSQSGASVIVVDHGVDTGPILAQQRVPVHPDDTADSLHERIKPVERQLLIQVVTKIAQGELNLQATS